ncbi:MAG: ATP-binding protein [Thermoanaerobaculales bacterium]|jgi:anti-sigma regulatory factor (Ser/Thr protein kinase)|nr:ATP-binding protein [Thermoanaerobaculales bacterium]
MSEELRLELRSEPRLLACVRVLVRAWLETSGVGGERAEGMVLAVDEACSNAIRHSYGGRCDGVVRLAMTSGAGLIEVRLCDDGAPCPSAGLEARPLEPPDPDHLRPGGLGVQLMHRAFDEVLFCPGREAGNCVILRARIEE